MEWKLRRVRDGVMTLGLACALAVAEGGKAVAQTAALTLTVRPREMATGTQNPARGEYFLDSVPNAIVSVPPQCVGAKRCPLFIFLPGAAQPASVTTGWLRPVADRYGMILLAPTTYETNIMDAALKETLRRFAIDPEKIAIIGRCASGAAAMQFGIGNGRVFSRIVSISGGVPTDGMDPQNTTAEFLIDHGIEEPADAFPAVNALRRNGNPVRHTVTIRGHEHQAEDYDFLGHWLQESWTTPPARRPPPTVVADPLPLLTTDALARMTAFWTRFLQEPAAIRTAGRRAYTRDVIAPIVGERPVVPMVDMAALAVHYPSVAAALKQAGLTGQQHDAYRIALLTAMVVRALVTQQYAHQIGPVEPTSVLGKNLAFLREHADELTALADAGIEDQDRLFGIGGFTNPQQVEQMGPLGIWRTP